MKDSRVGFGDNQCPTVTLRPALLEIVEGGETLQAPVWGLWVDGWFGFADMAAVAIPLYTDYVRRGILTLHPKDNG